MVRFEKLFVRGGGGGWVGHGGLGWPRAVGVIGEGRGEWEGGRVNVVGDSRG